MGKFAKRAKSGYLVGFDRCNSYRVYFPDEGRVVISRDVSFDESSPGTIRNAGEESNTPLDSVAFDYPLTPLLILDGNDQLTSMQTQTPPSNTATMTQTSIPLTQRSITLTPPPLTLPPLTEEDEDCDNFHDAHEAVTYDPNIRRSTRRCKRPERYGFDSTMLVTQIHMGNDASGTPTTYREAVSGPHANEWRTATEEEIAQINKKRTWKLVQLRSDSKTVKNRWVFATKPDLQRKLLRRRARLVAKGFTQQKDVDYNEVFAPVVRYSTVRMMLALAAQLGLELCLVDVKTAFLNGKSEETIFMDQP